MLDIGRCYDYMQGFQKALTTAETCQLLCSEKPATFFPKEETSSFNYFVKKSYNNIIKYK